MNTQQRFYVYCYKDPSRHNEAFYVGKGEGRRKMSHLYRTDHHPMTYRIKKMTSQGVMPVISLLCQNVDEELAFLVEQEAIKLFGRKDLKTGTLLNLTDGGCGGIANASASTKAKMRAHAIKVHTGRKRSDITKKRIGESRKKPCTVDGTVIYPSVTSMIKVLGQGVRGTKHPNFRYVGAP